MLILQINITNEVRTDSNHVCKKKHFETQEASLFWDQNELVEYLFFC